MLIRRLARSSKVRFSASAIAAVALAALSLRCSSSTVGQPERVATSKARLGWSQTANWLQYGFDSTHSGSNPYETTIGPQNVAHLVPSTLFGSVSTPVSPLAANGMLYVISPKAGTLQAVDPYSGANIWTAPLPAGSLQIATSSNIMPVMMALDSGANFIYAVAADGFIHKFDAYGGAEQAGGWPVRIVDPTQFANITITGSLTVGTEASTGYDYLYVSTGKSDGGLDKIGYVMAINLSSSTPTVNVFNGVCSSVGSKLIARGGCSTARTDNDSAGIWARGGVTFDPTTQHVYAVTGNGDFSTAKTLWGDTVLELPPNGAPQVFQGHAGWPLDSYTPSTPGSLEGGDEDLGSSSLMVLTNNVTVYPQHLAMTAGKDGFLRLLNLDNLSGTGLPGAQGGEVGTTALTAYSSGGALPNQVMTPSATWVNPVDNSTWVFVSVRNGSNAASTLVAYTLTAPNGGWGLPTLQLQWHISAATRGGGATVANGVLYYSDATALYALDPTTSRQLHAPFSMTTTGVPQAPVVVNGMVYMTDGTTLHAFMVQEYFDWSSWCPSSCGAGQSKSSPFNTTMWNYSQGYCYITGPDSLNPSFDANTVYMSVDQNDNYVLAGTVDATTKAHAHIGAVCIPWSYINAPQQTWPGNVYMSGSTSAAQNGLPPPAPTPKHGYAAQKSSTASGEHQHYFTGAPQTMPPSGTFGVNDKIYVWVYLVPGDVPSEIMVQFFDGSGTWNHRAYWGANDIGWGTDGTATRHHEGNVPATGSWQQLSFLASDVGMNGLTAGGMAFTLYGGSAYWDDAGYLINGSGAEQVWVDDMPPAGAVLAEDGGDGWVWSTSWAKSSSATLPANQWQMCQLSGTTGAWPSSGTGRNVFLKWPGEAGSTPQGSWTLQQTQIASGDAASTSCVDTGLTGYNEILGQYYDTLSYTEEIAGFQVNAGGATILYPFSLDGTAASDSEVCWVTGIMGGTAKSGSNNSPDVGIATDDGQSPVLPFPGRAGYDLLLHADHGASSALGICYSVAPGYGGGFEY